MRRKMHHGGGGQRSGGGSGGGSGGAGRRRFTRKPGGGGGGGNQQRFGGAGDDQEFVNPRMRKQVQTNRDKYLAMGRDALAAGDRVEAEYYFQHADHYLRILNLIDAQFQPRQPRESVAGDAPEDADATMEAEEEESMAAEDPIELSDDPNAGAQLADVLPAARI